MSGICGWIGGGRAGVKPVETLQAMISGLFARDDFVSASRALDGHAAGVLGPPAAADLATDGPVWAAIEGSPRWLSKDLADLAGREGNAAALAAAFRDRGDKLFELLHGAWALAAIDTETNAGLIAIDRLAIRPLCYAVTADGDLVFGTTVDSVVAHSSVTAAINMQAIFDYMFFTRSPAPGTIYRDIRKLLPGQCLRFENGKDKPRFFWALDYGADEARDPASLEAELVEVLSEAVASGTANAEGETLGAFLSGGVDSSTVTGLLAAAAPGRVKAFSVGFDAAGYDEMSYARTAARHFGVEHHEYYVTPKDVVDFIPTIAEIYDEPYGNSSAVPAYYCARMARETGVQLMFAGDGGDEVFAGNGRYARQRVFEAYGKIPRWCRRGFLEPLAFGLPGGEALVPLRKLRNYIDRANTPMPDRLATNNFYTGHPMSEIFLPEIARGLDPRRPFELMRQHYQTPDTPSALNRMLHLDLRITLADDDLRKVERTSEFAGVSVRYPLLDERVVEFSGKVPPELKLKGSRLRYFFKHAMRDFLPRETLTKPKQGFGLPFGLWLRKDRALQELSYDSLTDLKKRGLFLPDFVDGAIETHRSGHHSFHGEIVWVLMLLELWFRFHVDNAGSG